MASTSYVQGMDAICLILTTHLNERYSFWAFVCICNICLKDYFTENMLGSNGIDGFLRVVEGENILVWKHFTYWSRSSSGSKCRGSYRNHVRRSRAHRANDLYT